MHHSSRINSLCYLGKRLDFAKCKEFTVQSIRVKLEIRPAFPESISRALAVPLVERQSKQTRARARARLQSRNSAEIVAEVHRMSDNEIGAGRERVFTVWNGG